MNWLFRLTIPNDQGFLNTVHTVAAKAAEHAKYTPEDARRMAQTVAAAAGAAVQASAEGGHPVDVQFDWRDGRFEVSLRYVDERTLGTHLTISRDGMEDLDFSRDGRFTVCRMARKLPGPQEQ